MGWGGTCRIGSAKMLGNIVDIYAHNNNKQTSKQTNKQKQLIQNTLAVESVVSQSVFNVM